MLWPSRCFYVSCWIVWPIRARRAGPAWLDRPAYHDTGRSGCLSDSAIRSKGFHESRDRVSDGRKSGDVVRSLISREIGDLGYDEPEEIAEWFYLKQRIPSFCTALFPSAGRFIKQYNPYFNRRITELVPLLRNTVKAEGGVHKYIIRNNSAALARYPLDTGKTAGLAPGLRRLPLYYRLKARNISRRAVNKASMIAVKRQLVVNYKRDYAGWFATYHGDFMRSVLRHETMITRDLLDRETLDSAVDKLLGGNNSVVYAVTNEMCVEF